MNRLEFLEQCVQAGISICPQPRMFLEHETVYCVRKQATFLYPGGWESSYTYPTREVAQSKVEEFFKSGKEPPPWWSEK